MATSVEELVPTGRQQHWLVLFAVLAVLLFGYRAYDTSRQFRPSEWQPAESRHQVDLNRAEPAELMQIPGVGPAMAEAIVRHRTEHGRFNRIEELTAVHGIGDKTLEKLRPWLAVEPIKPEPKPTLPARPSGPEPPPILVEKLERKPAEPAVELANAESPTLASPVHVPMTEPSQNDQGEPGIDINSAPAHELVKLPGIGPVLSQRIVEARQQRRFTNVDDLQRVHGIGPKTVASLRAHVVCR